MEKGVVERDGEDGTVSHPLASPEAFEIVSDAWIRCGWDTKYVYSFTWLGRPIIQLPEDLLRIQEVISTTQPDVIVETGVAHGGSLVFYATLCKVLDKGRVIGIDVEIRPSNRKAIETHPLFPLITLIEGSSIELSTVDRVKSEIRPGESVMLILDSNHVKDHVLAELEAYAPLVTRGCYLVVEDGIMERVVGAPRTKPEWAWDNPVQAAREFVESHPEFAFQEPPFAFNEGKITERVTYWPHGYLLRTS